MPYGSYLYCVMNLLIRIRQRNHIVVRIAQNIAVLTCVVPNAPVRQLIQRPLSGYARKHAHTL